MCCSMDNQGLVGLSDLPKRHLNPTIIAFRTANTNVAEGCGKGSDCLFIVLHEGRLFAARFHLWFHGSSVMLFRLEDEPRQFFSGVRRHTSFPQTSKPSAQINKPDRREFAIPASIDRHKLRQTLEENIELDTILTHAMIPGVNRAAADRLGSFVYSLPKRRNKPPEMQKGATFGATPSQLAGRLKMATIADSESARPQRLLLEVKFLHQRHKARIGSQRIEDAVSLEPDQPL
jgi:hypothetical protein